MKPLALVAALLVIGASGTVFLVSRAVGPNITLADAQLLPMAGGHALVVSIDNPGAADRLVEVSTSGEGQLMVVGALFSEGLAIPAGAKPSLSVDGAHGMLMALGGETGEGRLVPISLTFEKAGTVSTRARIVGGMQMDHGADYPVPLGEPAPQVAIGAVETRDGWQVTIVAESFTFSREAVDTAHQPGVGHGHLYLNGLKLGRIYGPDVTLGALPAGDHELRVTLNTNDHQTYVVDGLPVTAAILIGSD